MASTPSVGAITTAGKRVMHMKVQELDTKRIEEWSHSADEPPWLTSHRQAAWAAYEQAPLPPSTAEAWKYTNLEKMADWGATAWPRKDAAELATDSTMAAAATVITCSLGEAVQRYPDLVRPYLVDQAAGQEFSGVAGQPYGGVRYLYQQEALWDRGFFIFVPRGIAVTAPLCGHITGTQGGAAIFPRTIVVLEDGASLTYVEEFRSSSALRERATCHARAEFYLGERSRLQYLAIQRWHDAMTHLAHQHARVGRDAHFTSLAVTLGGQMVKTITESQLTAPGAESLLCGLTFGDRTQHVDHHTLQTHLAPHTTSDLLFKAALKDQAKAIYTGLIRMTGKAQQGVAYQASRNLLLSEEAQANAIPQLEIAANDVKCSHGATMGPVDQQQLYYLRTRGLTQAEAERMLVNGFFEELITKIPDPTMAEMVRAAIALKQGGAT